MKRMVLFLCTGDTCRGPMSAGLTAKLLQDLGVRDIDVRSAGVMTVTGLLATTETTQMLKSVNVELERHRSTPVSVELLRKCDLILGMTPLHVQHALRMAPEIKGRVFLLKEYTRSDLKKVQIDDPMGNTLEVYKKVFNEIRSACQKFMKTAYVTGKGEKDAAARDDKKARKGTAAKATAKKSKAAAPAKVKTAAKTPASSGNSKSKPAAKTPATAVKSVAAKAKVGAPAPPKTKAKVAVKGKQVKAVGSSK